jgi:hypothetical protein
MGKTNKKLGLDRETLRPLNADALTPVQGGNAASPLFRCGVPTFLTPHLPASFSCR